MNVWLVHSRYYFTMTGKVRNLFSVTCRVQPVLPDGAGEADVKACARGLVDVYMDVLDRVFGELVKGKRKPFLQDSPNQVTVGYRFGGYGRKLPIANLTRRARAVSACQAGAIRADPGSSTDWRRQSTVLIGNRAGRSAATISLLRQWRMTQ